jgi:hypothetical protein
VYDGNLVPLYINLAFARRDEGKPQENLSQYNWSMTQDFNLQPPEYKAGVLTNRVQLWFISVFLLL